MDRDTGSEPAFSGLLLLAATLSFAAGIIHFIVTPEHLGEWWGYGFFFLMVGIGQITYGLVLLMRPLARQAMGEPESGPDVSGRILYLAAAWANLAVVALYAVTRTMGIPLFGPQAGHVEPFDVLSVAATVTEVALAVALYILAKQAGAVSGRASVTVRP